MSKRRTNSLFSAVCLAGLGLRLAVAISLGNAIVRATDEYSYSALAQRVASGYGYSFAEGWYPFTPAGAPTAHWSFLYAAFVASVYELAGYHPLVARLVQATLGSVLLPWLIYRLTRRLFPAWPHVALVAAACAAVYAYFVLYAAQLMTETFFIAALLWSLERALALTAGGDSAKRDPKVAGPKSILEHDAWRWKTALTLGISLGIAALLRQSVLPWVALLFAWLLFQSLRPAEYGEHAPCRARRIAMLISAGMMMLLFIVPFTIRNYVVYGDFLLLNSNAGYAMYSAQHPLHGTDFQAFVAAPLPEELLARELNEAQWDQELMRRGVDFVAADLVRYLQLSTSRVLDFFEFWPTDTTLLHNAGRLLSFTLFLPFYITGIILAMRETGRHSRGCRDFWAQPISLLLLFISSYSLLHIFTWAMPRYRLPIDAVAMPFAALALEESWYVLRVHLPRLSRDRRPPRFVRRV